MGNVETSRLPWSKTAFTSGGNTLWYSSLTATAGLAHQRNVWGTGVGLYTRPRISITALPGRSVNPAAPRWWNIRSRSLTHTVAPPSGSSSIAKSTGI